MPEERNRQNEISFRLPLRAPLTALDTFRSDVRRPPARAEDSRGGGSAALSKGTIGAADVNLIAIHNILARGIRGGAGEGLGINAVEHHHEDFLSFVVVAALPSVHVIRNVKTDSLTSQVFRQIARQ